MTRHADAGWRGGRGVVLRNQTDER